MSIGKWGKRNARKVAHSGLDDVLSTGACPRDVGGVALGEDGDGLAVDDELAVGLLDGSLEASVDGIVLEHVDLNRGMSRVDGGSLGGRH